MTKKTIKEIINKETIVQSSIFLVLGIIIGVCFVLIILPKRIAKLSNGEEIAATVGKYNVTANDIYENLKSNYGVSAIFNIIDKTYLESKYQLTSEDEQEINKNMEYYYSQYEQYYQKTKKEFLKDNGFNTEANFKAYLTLDYLRNKYYEEYLNSKITNEQIEEYYAKNVFAPFDVEHILVKVTSDVDDKTAKDLATEILNNLKNGSSWDGVKSVYKSQITVESFEVSFESNLEESFFNAAKTMDANSISNDLVKTSYGYHIINKKGLKDKPTLEKATPSIKKALTTLLKQKNEYSYERVLIEMRKEAKMEISDSELKKAYKEYTDSLEEIE